MNSKIKLLLLIAVIVILLAGALVWYLVSTTRGSGYVTKFALSKYVEAEQVDIGKIEGDLIELLSLSDIEFKDLEWLPEGSILKIQKLDVSFRSLSLEGMNVKIQNARLKLPLSEPIFFYGTLQDGVLNLNVYARLINVKETLDLFIESKDLPNLSGQISGLDADIKGSFIEPMISGGFMLDKLIRDGFTVVNCPVTFSLSLKDLKQELKINGEVVLKEGQLSGPKTAQVILKESQIQFTGSPQEPTLNLNAESTVESTKINIVMKGTIEEPKFKLSSKPPNPEDKLLLMLATNKSWKAQDAALNNGALSTDIYADFIDYFLLGGSGSKLAKRFGISDVFFRYDSKAKGLSVTKEVSNKATASYGVEQSQTLDGTSVTSQKIGGEYKITDSISIGAEKEIKQDNAVDKTQESQKTDDKVTLKFKTEF